MLCLVSQSDASQWEVRAVCERRRSSVPRTLAWTFSMMNKMTPRLALDMYVLAQGVKTGVYRVCDELYGRLAASPRFSPRLLVRPGDEAKAGEYIATNRLPGVVLDGSLSPPSASADILLSPFGVAPPQWLDDHHVLKAHIIHDLIAIYRPEYFSQEASAEVRAIIESLDERTVIFVNSEHTKKELLAYRPELSPGQVTLIPLAAGSRFKPCGDPEVRSSMRAKYGIPSEVPYVLSLATLEIRKNLDQVVNAFVRYLEQHEGSPMRLVLAGMSGWKLEKLDAALAAAGRWRDRIVLTGFVADEDLSALYSDALCFIYLSRYEGFGLPPLEAMACGAPVICADNSSLPEVVGGAGVMLDADDAQGVVQAIQQISDSGALREELSRRGMQRALLFNWDRCAEIVMDTLSAAYERHAARPPNLKRRATVLPATPEGLAAVSVDSMPEASFFGYRNGSLGPSFAAHGAPLSNRADAAWPIWSERLPISTATPADRPEGGLRTQGHSKFGTSDTPLVSYVTVVRNNKATLARTIESVQHQTYGNVEHIVLDGASTDGTLDVILEYAHRLDYYVSEPDAGLYDAVNKAVPLARGQLICVLNSDDWLEPHAAEIAVRRMHGMFEEPALLMTAALVRDRDILHEWHPAFVHPGSYFICANDCHNGIYATRAAYERSGPYDSSYKIAADFKWIMTCLESGSKFVYTKEPTVNYSLGGTSSDQRQHSMDCMRVVSERFDFLSPVEVSGLYHSFFMFTGAFSADEGSRPNNHTQFLRRVFAAHESKPDFVSALGWAAMATLQHPVDAAVATQPAPPAQAPAVPSFRRSVKELAKSILHKHPGLYGAAARGYRRLRG
ncbi:PGL/p-HBAD biosynthesis glycosyltransferase/MT3031 [Variovorax sp. RA8]|nr:PGL/p-HBAD biosynthesis glycosyltransferase/MT3031 [Variovorax sp. RA8]